MEAHVHVAELAAGAAQRGEARGLALERRADLEPSIGMKVWSE
jgi:hypothetical protein